MEIAIIYHMFPHYRAGVMRALDQSRHHNYTFFGDLKRFDGIEPANGAAVKRFVAAPYWRYHGFYWQWAAVSVAISPRFDAVIYLGNPNFISTWIGATLARLVRKRVLFWTHGWLRGESRPRALMRRLYYRLGHRVLVYGERAKRLGAADGFPDERIDVIYNSLDTDAADAIFAGIERGDAVQDPRTLFADPDRPLLICTARLTALCRFDLLLDAAERLRDAGRPANVLLVGDGPERSHLEELARAKSLDVHCYGACYDEPTLGALIYAADLTVSPGKVGLTAMHSLMYGTPVITHSDLDAQMPEVEAIVDGETGAFFARDDVADLTRAIDSWLGRTIDRAKVRSACRRMIATKWNPLNQVRLIEAAIGDPR